MAKTLYRTLLKIELRIIILLLLCILAAAGWTTWRRQALRQQIRAAPLHSVTPSQRATEVPTPEPEEQTAQALIGFASYYSDDLHGNPTASGEPYDKEQLTAAHREFPFGTRVRVTNLDNDKTVVVRINDRGPHNAERIIDVSGKAAEMLGLIRSGVANVRLEIVE